MEFPRRYSYDPQWKHILVCFAASFVPVVLIRSHWVSFGIGAALGTVPIVWALLLGLRRIVFPRFLELEEDALLLPSGPFRGQTTRISYADIDWTQEIIHPHWSGLDLHVKGRAFTVTSLFLPEMASYIAISEFVRARVKPQEKRQRQSGEPHQYCFQCSWDGNGAIYDSDEKVLWHVSTQPRKGFRRYLKWFGQIPTFIVCDTAERELLRVVENRKLFSSQIVMIENGLSICTIKQRSILLNRYTLNFANGLQWIFKMPLFTVNFNGASETGAKIQVRLWTHNVWYVLIDPEIDSPQLVAAMAFIHRERLRRV